MSSPCRLYLAALLAVTLAAPAHAQPIFPDLQGSELREALAAMYTPVQVLSEAASKDTLYAVIDRATVDGVDGTVGLYTGFFVPFDCDPSCDPSQDVFNGGAGINQEHVWPRSLGAGSGTAERDMHHLFPTRVAVNEARGNLPFGESPDDETTAWYYLDQTESEPPAEERDAWSELLGSVRFEPREEKKGDVARAAFYFYAVYGPDGEGQADEAFFEGMKETLLAWHEADLPTAEEVVRSERVAAYQATGSGEPAINPFVHDATLARRAFFGPVLYVRQGNDLDLALQTGVSWGSAFDDLQTALSKRDAYPYVGEVWVTEGTYHPTDENDSTASFELRDGLVLYGGFGGTETSVDERDWEAHPAVLSGDIGEVGDPSDNSRSVVTATDVEGGTLDGFIVTGGTSSGGGLAASNSFVIVRRCTFAGNRSPSSGGALLLYGGTYQLVETTAVDNEAVDDGGALFASSSSLLLSDALFESNSARAGGGLASEETDLVILSSTFANNTASSGGALQALGATLLVDGSTFEENEANSGGAIDARNLRADILRSEFRANSAASLELARGGAIRLLQAPLTVLSSEFVGNTAVARAATGGAIQAEQTDEMTIANSLFVQNRAEATEAAGGFAEGGAISTSTTDLIVVSVTIADNAAFVPGGGSTQGRGGISLIGTATVRNTVFWDNASGDIRPDQDVSYSLIPGGYQGEYIVDAPPLFVDASSGDYRLQAGSPAIDFGLATSLLPDTFDLDGDGDTDEPLPLDLDGNPRIQGNEVDLGPYESPFTVSTEPVAGVPAVDALSAAYPNPFRSHTALTLTVAEPRHVRVEAFDVLGRRVGVLYDGEVQPGERVELALDGRGLPAGVYLVRATGDGLHLTRRITLVR